METVGPYRVVKELGRGAMGVVFEAFDPGIGRTVAVKVIRYQPLATADEDAQLKLRFAREASAAGRLSHPNIVTVYQFGEHDGMKYLAMEFITGASLDAMLAPAVPLPLATALGILAQVASALDYAHAQGIVHRDIKPANILVKADGTVKLTDFGIARITSQTVTQTGFVMGTPAFMAPEQIMAFRVDGRADQYSLAVVAYQMLSGKRPFEAPTDQAVLFKILHEEPRSLEEVNALVPRALAAVIRRGLSKDASQRYPNCSELVAAMRAAAVSPPVAPRPAQSPNVDSPYYTAPAPRPVGATRLWPVIAACAVLAVSGAVWLGSRGARVGQGQSNVPAIQPATEAAPPVPTAEARKDGQPGKPSMLAMGQSGGARRAATEESADGTQLLSPPARAAVAMTNQSVLDLANAGVPEVTVINQIRAASRTVFDLSTNGVIQLTKGGVSAAIIEVMRNPRRDASRASPTASNPAPAGMTQSTKSVTAGASSQKAELQGAGGAGAQPGGTAGSDIDRVEPAPEATAPPVPRIRTVVIPSGTPFIISLAENVPTSLTAGQGINFVVTRDVKAGDVVVIAKGTPISGEVVDPGGSKRVEILPLKKMATFKLATVGSTAGTKLAIRATAPYALNPAHPIEPLGGKSKEWLAPSGTAYTVYIDGDQTVTIKY